MQIDDGDVASLIKCATYKNHVSELTEFHRKQMRLGDGLTALLSRPNLPPQFCEASCVQVRNGEQITFRDRGAPIRVFSAPIPEHHKRICEHNSTSGPVEVRGQLMCQVCVLRFIVTSRQ